MSHAEPDPQAVWMYRLGSAAAFAIGGGYLVIIALYVFIGAPPRGAEALLPYIAENIANWRAILWLSVLTDVLFLAVAAALYEALQRLHRSAILVAAAWVALFVFLDLTLTWTNYAVLIALGERYAGATDVAQQTLLLEIARYPVLIVESNLLFVYNSLTLALGALIAGCVMRKGVFSKGTAYLGIATGVVGVLAVVGPLFVEVLSLSIVLASLLTMVWLFFVGFGLSRLTRPLPSVPAPLDS